MSQSYAYDASLHRAGTVAASGRCSWHGSDGLAAGSCASDAVVSFQDQQGKWQSGCQVALEQLVERGYITPLGQGA